MKLSRIFLLVVAIVSACALSRADSFVQSYSFEQDGTYEGTSGARLQDTWNAQGFSSELGTLNSVRFTFDLAASSEAYEYLYGGGGTVAAFIDVNTTFIFGQATDSFGFKGPGAKVTGEPRFVPRGGRFGVAADFQLSGSWVLNDPEQLKAFYRDMISVWSSTVFFGNTGFGATSVAGKVDLTLTYNYTPVPDVSSTLALPSAGLVGLTFCRRTRSSM